ncbi:hypothetical protein EDD11_008665 [Mortierella claussenii]|nr:hypothetical protein EDD11_008665 [Mortierella claussenii]
MSSTTAAIDHGHDNVTALLERREDHIPPALEIAGVTAQVEMTTRPPSSGQSVQSSAQSTLFSSSASTCPVLGPPDADPSTLTQRSSHPAMSPTAIETATISLASASPSLPEPASIPLPPSPAPALSLGQLPIFTSADDPPPYSPTHTILPHYFSLEPIPIRSYSIKDSTSSLPFLYDFWLCTTTQQHPSSSSRPQSPGIQLQERGLSSQSQNELKYCIIRPQHTDRTAVPLTNSLAPNAYFIPALALVAADYPARWIWWGTEALQMVVFGRQLKNIIMEWRWKHGRMRIGGPIVHRLVGCSFRVTPDRKYCWKQGSGKRRPATASTAAGHVVGQGQAGTGARSRRGDTTVLQLASAEPLSRIAGSNWFGSFISRVASPTPSTATDNADTFSSIPLEGVQVPVPASTTQATSGREQNPMEIATLQDLDVAAHEDDFDAQEAGCYHCREESPNGVAGRIVAVYKPGHPANRARDRPATSRRLEIYAEVGERCETAMMLMCVRLDDLFMSIPDEKKGPLVSARTTAPASGDASGDVEIATSAQVGEDSLESQIAQGSEDLRGGAVGTAAAGSGAMASDDQRSELSAMKRLLLSRYTWRSWLKWVVATVLIAVVVVLILKPKFTH